MTDWYEYPYNYSNGTSVNGLGDYFNWAFYVSNYSLSYGFLLIIWLATFGFSLMLGSRKAILVSSFITFFFSIYLVRLGSINMTIPFILIALTIVGALLSKDDSSL